MTPEQEKAAIEAMTLGRAVSEGIGAEDWDWFSSHCREHTRAEFTALQAFLKEQGMVVVPREPTDEMLNDGDMEFPQYREGYERLQYLKQAWQAMIQAWEQDDDE